jgi:hypothetical protein
MKHITSCENFQRTGKFTQPALPTLPEKGVLDTKVILLLETIDDILKEFDQPTRFSPNKHSSNALLIHLYHLHNLPVALAVV